MKTPIPTLLTLFTILCVGSTLMAQPFGAGERGEGFGKEENRLQKLGDLLELTPDQAERWTLVSETHRQTLRAHGQEIRSAREGIRELASTENPDLEQLGQMALDLHRGMEAMGALRETLEADLKSILTQEQEEKFELLLEARQSFGGEGRGREGRRPRGGRSGGGR